MEDLTPQRSPANYTKIYEYEVSKSVSFTLMQISWKTSHGAVQVSDVCHFKNLCVGNYQGNHLSGRQKYWLARPSEGLDVAYITDGEVVEAESVFRRCFNAQFTPAPEFSLRPLLHDPKKTKTIKGHSVGSVKADFGAHPISWLNTWSRLVSVAANVPDMLATFGVTREAFFSQIIVSTHVLLGKSSLEVMSNLLVLTLISAIRARLQTERVDKLHERRICSYCSRISTGGP